MTGALQAAFFLFAPVTLSLTLAPLEARAQVAAPNSNDMGDPDPISVLDEKKRRVKGPSIPELEDHETPGAPQPPPPEIPGEAAAADPAAPGAGEAKAGDASTASATTETTTTTTVTTKKSSKKTGSKSAKSKKSAEAASAPADAALSAEKPAPKKKSAKKKKEVPPPQEAEAMAESLPPIPAEASPAEAPAPKRSSAKKKKEAEEKAAAEAATVAAKGADKGLIPAPKRFQPVLKALPRSLPVYRYGGVNVPPVDFAQVGPRPVARIAPIFLTYYITERGVEEVGVIESTEAGVPTAAEFQYVFVKTRSNAKHFVVVKEMPPITGLSGYKDMDSGPRPIEVQGEIELIEEVNPRENLWRALVKRSLAPIEIGSVLIEDKIKMFDPSPGHPINGPELKIIGGQYSSDRHLVGEGSIVYMMGYPEAARKGTTLQIKAVSKLRNPESKAITNERTIGALKVVEVHGRYSTGFIVSAREDIYVGDAVGGPLIGSEPGLSQQGGGADLDFDEDGKGVGDKVQPPDPASKGSDDELSID